MAEDLHSFGYPLGQPVVPVEGQTSMDDMVLRLVCDTRVSFDLTKNFIDNVPDALFFGSAGKIKLGSGGRNITVDLTKNSKRINLTVIGLPDPISRANPYPHIDVTMDSPNGGYDFRNELEPDGSKFTYIQHEAASGAPDAQISALHTMSLKFNNGHTLLLYNTDTGQTIYTADLLEDYIRKVPVYNTQAAVDARDEFDITLDITSSLGVNVTVDGWDIGTSGNIIQ